MKFVDLVSGSSRIDSLWYINKPYIVIYIRFALWNAKSLTPDFIMQQIKFPLNQRTRWFLKKKLTLKDQCWLIALVELCLSDWLAWYRGYWVLCFLYWCLFFRLIGWLMPLVLLLLFYLRKMKEKRICFTACQKTRRLRYFMICLFDWRS